MRRFCAAVHARALVERRIVKLLEGGLIVVALLLLLLPLDAGMLKTLRVESSGRSGAVAKPVMDIGGNVVPAGL